MDPSTPRNLVSCDAGALWAETRLLNGAGYELDQVDVLDMFPQTSHVEVVGLGSPHRSEVTPTAWAPLTWFMTVLVQAFDDHGHSWPPTHIDSKSTFYPNLETVEQCRHDPSAGLPERVTQCDSSTVDIQLVNHVNA